MQQRDILLVLGSIWFVFIRYYNYSCRQQDDIQRQQLVSSTLQLGMLTKINHRSILLS
jgi:hypothetical protein